MPVTVPELLPNVVRALRNGNAKGAGLRLYVPTELTKQLGVAPGQVYRMTRLEDGRLRLTPADAALQPAPPRRAVAAEPEPRIRPELTPTEAQALEACLATGDRSARETLLGIAKRLRRRMRKAGWPTPNRTEDHLERAQVDEEAAAWAS